MVCKGVWVHKVYGMICKVMYNYNNRIYSRHSIIGALRITSV